MKGIIVAGIVVLTAASSLAAGEIRPLDAKPGLWETKARTEMGGMPKMQGTPSIPPEALAKLPPEQRARMEAMMKSRAGGGPMETTTKFCVTRESLSNGMAFSKMDKSCTPTVTSSSGSKQEIHMECNREGMKMTGDLTVERLDAEHMKGNMVMKGGNESRPFDMKMSFETKWLATDCGDVKPAVAK